MAHSVGHGHRPALRHPEQREAVESRGLDHGVEIVHPVVEREARNGPVREAAAALVVADQLAVACQSAQPVGPNRGRPLQVEVRHPVGGLEQGRARADRGVGDAGAVGGPAEPDRLAVRTARRVGRGRIGVGLRPAASGRIASNDRRCGYEPVAAPMDGADQVLPTASVPDGQARGPQRRGERRLADEAVSPHFVEEFVLRYHPVPVLDQMAQQIQGPGLHMDRLTGPAEQMPGHVELEIPEAILLPLHLCSVQVSGVGVHVNEWWACGGMVGGLRTRDACRVHRAHRCVGPGRRTVVASRSAAGWLCDVDAVGSGESVEPVGPALADGAEFPDLLAVGGVSVELGNGHGADGRVGG